MSNMKILKKLEWNTGRVYRADGQPITAYLLELSPYQNAIYFNDAARMIDGMIEVHLTMPFDTDHAFKTHVMHCYDFSQHTGLLHISDRTKANLGLSRNEVTCGELRSRIRCLEDEVEAGA